MSRESKGGLAGVLLLRDFIALFHYTQKPPFWRLFNLGCLAINLRARLCEFVK